MPPKTAAKSAEKAVKGDEGKVPRKKYLSSLSLSLMPRSFRVLVSSRRGEYKANPCHRSNVRTDAADGLTVSGSTEVSQAGKPVDLIIV
jgi:hypothetical protein